MTDSKVDEHDYYSCYSYLKINHHKLFTKYRIKTSFNGIECNMAWILHSWAVFSFMQYPAILHSKLLNNRYIIYIIIFK